MFDFNEDDDLYDEDKEDDFEIISYYCLDCNYRWEINKTVNYYEDSIEMYDEMIFDDNQVCPMCGSPDIERN